MFLSTQEQSELFRYYDKNNDGHISVVEFLQGIQEQMSNQRLSAVKAAFQYLDADCQGWLSLESLFQNFIAAKHPRVVTREKNCETVTEEFQSTVEKYAQGGRLSEEGFLAYYSSLSSTIPIENDEYFINLLTGCWGINSSSDYISPNRLAQIEDVFYEKIRQKTRATEDEGKVLIRLFKFFDTDESGSVSVYEFSSALERLGCTFNRNEIVALFSKYNKEQSGKMSYEELARLFATKGAGNTNQFSYSRTSGFNKQ